MIQFESMTWFLFKRVYCSGQQQYHKAEEAANNLVFKYQLILCSLFSVSVFLVGKK